MLISKFMCVKTRHLWKIIDLSEWLLIWGNYIDNFLKFYTIDDFWSNGISVAEGPIGTIGVLESKWNKKDYEINKNIYFEACWESCSSFLRCSISTVCNISLIVDIYALNYIQYWK